MTEPPIRYDEAFITLLAECDQGHQFPVTFPRSKPADSVLVGECMRCKKPFVLTVPQSVLLKV